MRRVVYALLFLAVIITLLIVYLGIADAETREVTCNFHIGGKPFTFVGSIEGWNELQKQIKLNNVLCEIMSDEAAGLHPYAKIKLAKKLAKELEE